MQGERIIFQSQWLSVSERAQGKSQANSSELELNTIQLGVYELRVSVEL